MRWVRSTLVAALTAAQVIPAAAAELEQPPIQSSQARIGVFAGARFNVSLNGRRQPIRGGLAFAGSRTTSSVDQRIVTISKGLELDFVDKEPARLSFAGRPLNGIDDRRLGMSKTGKTVLIVGGVVLLAAIIAAAAVVEAVNDNSD